MARQLLLVTLIAAVVASASLDGHHDSASTKTLGSNYACPSKDVNLTGCAAAVANCITNCSTGGWESCFDCIAGETGSNGASTKQCCQTIFHFIPEVPCSVCNIFGVSNSSNASCPSKDVNLTGCTAAVANCITNCSTGDFKSCFDCIDGKTGSNGASTKQCCQTIFHFIPSVPCNVCEIFDGATLQEDHAALKPRDDNLPRKSFMKKL